MTSPELFQIFLKAHYQLLMSWAHHAISSSEQIIEFYLSSITEQKNIFSMLVARVGTVRKVLRPLDNSVQGCSQRFSTSRTQQRHSCRFNETLKVFQGRAHCTAIPILLLRTLKVINKKCLYVFDDNLRVLRLLKYY